MAVRRILPPVPQLVGKLRQQLREGAEIPELVERIEELLGGVQDFLQVLLDSEDEGLPVGHGATHRLDGVDPLDTGVPTNPSGAVASEGVADTYMRSDATIKQGIVTTKGDVLGHSSAPARVPVGADGQVLTADAAQALGVKWATAAGGNSRRFAWMFGG